MRIKNSKIIILNIIGLILFILPVFKLDLYTENYSTLSLGTRGYLYLLFMGIILGSLMGYETYKRNAVCGILIFVSLILGTLIPHQVPYGLRGNVHLFLAYLGGFILIVMTYLNLFLSRHDHLRQLFVLMICAAVLIYLKYGMVNTLSEIIIMISCMYCALYLYLE